MDGPLHHRPEGLGAGRHARCNPKKRARLRGQKVPPGQPRTSTEDGVLALAPLCRLIAQAVDGLAAACFRNAPALSLEAARSGAIARVSPAQRKRWQPGLATHCPEFIARRQLVWGVQRSQAHFDLVGAAPENGRTAVGAEESPGVAARFALDHDRLLGEYRGGVEQGSMMLAAIKAVAKADPVGMSRRHEPDLAAKAASGESNRAFIATHGLPRPHCATDANQISTEDFPASRAEALHLT